VVVLRLVPPVAPRDVGRDGDGGEQGERGVPPLEPLVGQRERVQRGRQRADGERVPDRVALAGALRRASELGVVERLHRLREAVGPLAVGQRHCRLRAGLPGRVARRLHDEGGVPRRPGDGVVGDGDRLDLLQRDGAAVSLEQTALVPEFVPDAREREVVVARQRHRGADEPRAEDERGEPRDDEGDGRPRAAGDGERDQRRHVHEFDVREEKHRQHERSGVDGGDAQEDEFVRSDGEQQLLRLGAPGRALSPVGRPDWLRFSVGPARRGRRLGGRVRLPAVGVAPEVALEALRLVVADVPQGGLRLAAARRLDGEDGDAECALEEVLADVDVLDAVQWYLPLAPPEHARGDVERIGGQVVLEPAVVRHLVRAAGEEAPGQQRERHRPAHGVYRPGRDHADEKQRGRDGDAAGDRAIGNGGRVELHTASVRSLSLASSRSSVWMRCARSGVRPGMVTSAPREPAV